MKENFRCGGFAMVARFAEKIAEGRWVLAASSRFCMARRIRAAGAMGWAWMGAARVSRVRRRRV